MYYTTHSTTSILSSGEGRGTSRSPSPHRVCVLSCFRWSLTKLGRICCTAHVNVHVRTCSCIYCMIIMCTVLTGDAKISIARWDFNSKVRNEGWPYGPQALLPLCSHQAIHLMYTRACYVLGTIVTVESFPLTKTCSQEGKQKCTGTVIHNTPSVATYITELFIRYLAIAIFVGVEDGLVDYFLELFLC